MESGNRTDDMERRIAPDRMTEDGKKESEAIDRRVEELMAPEEKRPGKRIRALLNVSKAGAAGGKSLLQPVWWSLSFWPVQSLGAAARARESWWM